MVMSRTPASRTLSSSHTAGQSRGKANMGLLVKRASKKLKRKNYKQGEYPLKLYRRRRGGVSYLCQDEGNSQLLTDLKH